MKPLRDQHRQFYLVVYTQTDADVGQYHCGGGLDIGLNEAGIEEARKLARRFKKNPLKIKRILASPELRAVQMADVLHDEIKTKMTMLREFHDQFLGDWEGKPLSYSNGSTEPPRGEATAVFSDRVINGLVKVLQEPGVLLLVTHKRVAQVILKSVGVGSASVQSGVMYSIDVPAGEGAGSLREI